VDLDFVVVPMDLLYQRLSRSKGNYRFTCQSLPVKQQDGDT